MIYIKNIEKQRRKIYRGEKRKYIFRYTYVYAFDFSLFIIQFFFKKIHITFKINCNRSIINIIFSSIDNYNNKFKKTKLKNGNFSIS